MSKNSMKAPVKDGVLADNSSYSSNMIRNNICDEIDKLIGSGLILSSKEIYSRLPEETASGDIITFDGPAVPLVSLKTAITAVQSGSGTPSPSNPRPISGFSVVNVNRTGKNLLDGTRAKDFALATFNNSTSGENATGRYYTLLASYAINEVNVIPWVKFKENTVYTIILKLAKDNTATSTNLRVIYSDGTFSSITRASTSSDVLSSEIKVVTSQANKTIVGIVGRFESGRTYLYYDHIGIFEGAITDNDFEPYNGISVNIPLGRSVFGGNLNVTTGVLEITHENIASYNGEAINEPWISSMDSYSQGAVPTTGAQVVYPLATPITIQLTPTEITALLGVNNLWGDTGASEVVYKDFVSI